MYIINRTKPHSSAVLLLNHNLEEVKRNLVHSIHIILTLYKILKYLRYRSGLKFTIGVALLHSSYTSPYI